MSKAEIAAAPPVVDDLVLTDWRNGNSFNRASRVAYLKQIDVPGAATRDLLPPLFDPVLVKGDSMVLIGSEIQRDSAPSDSVVECVQGGSFGWVDRATLAFGSPARRRPSRTLRTLGHRAHG